MISIALLACRRQRLNGIILADLNTIHARIFVFAILLGLTGCGPTPTSSTPQPTASLLPYVTASPLPATQVPTEFPTIEPTLGPSPTPFVHVVAEGDTLLGIAIRYGVELNELLAANPGINTRIISIGQSITIPGADGNSPGSLLPTATPVPATLSPVVCYAAPVDSLWCLTTVSFPGDTPLEAIAVAIALFNAEGKQLASQVSYTPLNLLLPGTELPLIARFPAPAPAEYSASAQIVRSLGAGDSDQRYLPVEIAIEESEALDEGLRWSVRGSMSLAEEREDTNTTVALLAIARDRDGDVVGLRKLQLEGTADEAWKAEFALEIISLGPPITDVQVMAEALILQ